MRLAYNSVLVSLWNQSHITATAAGVSAIAARALFSKEHFWALHMWWLIESSQQPCDINTVSVSILLWGKQSVERLVSDKAGIRTQSFCFHSCALNHYGVLISQNDVANVQKKVKIASLRLLSLERPACKVSSWLASGNLNGELFSALI